MKSRNPAVLAAILVATALGLAGCGGTSDASSAAPVPARVSAADLTKVTLRVADQKGASAQSLLSAAGLLTDVPYKIQWSTFTSGPPELEAANAGAVDIGLVGNTPPIFAAAANGKIDVIAAYRSAKGDAVLTPSGSPLRGLADLRGKTVAVAKGSSANGTLLGVLNQAGLKPTDVKISYLQPADAYAAFSQRQVDAWVTWQPYVAEAVQGVSAGQLISGHDSISGAGLAGKPLSNGYSFLVAGRTALGDGGKNTAIADYLARLARAEAWAGQHPDQWAHIWSQQTGLALAAAQAAVQDVLVKLVPLDDSVVNSEQQLSDKFTAAGLLPGKVDFGSFVDRRFTSDVNGYLAQVNK